jgi:peroxiredoxin
MNSRGVLQTGDRSHCDESEELFESNVAAQGVRNFSSSSKWVTLFFMFALVSGVGLRRVQAGDPPKSEVASKPVVKNQITASESPASQTPANTLTGLRSVPRKAPAWELLDPTKKTHKSVEFAGHPYLLVFIRGLGCSHCRGQLTALGERRADLSAMKIPVVAICPDSTQGMSEAVRQERLADSLPFLFLSDESLKTFKAFGCYDGAELHGTFLIDGKGAIRWKQIGNDPYNDVEHLLELCRDLTLTVLATSSNVNAAGNGQAGAPGQVQIFTRRPSEMLHSTKLSFSEPDPGRKGKWQTLDNFKMPINPVLVALMHTGKLLIIAGSGNDPGNKNWQAAVWDPTTTNINVFNISWDMFCSGMVILPDGRPLVLGGTLLYDDDSPPKPYRPFWGQSKTAIFDPVAGTFADGPDMLQGRWYPTGTNLGDGSVLVDSGNDSRGRTNMTVQRWTGAAWEDAGAAFASIDLFPRQHLLPDGTVFVSGSNPDSQIYDPAKKSFKKTANTNLNKIRAYGTSVLLPLTPENKFKATVIIMGGSPDPGKQPGTNTTELIDLDPSVPNPRWVKGPNMVDERVQMNATILPDGRVLASGGSNKNEDNGSAVKEAQLYNVASNSFSSASMMEVPRLYHSNTVLLPDARVVALGGNPARKTYQPEVEIYSPPYLFDANGHLAARPTITGVAPGELHYGQPFIVSTPDADIKSIVLIRPGAVTHSIDMEQRLVGLNFGVVVGGYRAIAPGDGNLAPPGYYLLFILNHNGVPSEARFVHLSSDSGKN